MLLTDQYESCPIRAAPLFGGQFLKLPLQLAAAGRRRQKRSDDAEAKVRPAFMGPGRQRRCFDRRRHFYFFHPFGGAATVLYPPPSAVARHLLRELEKASHNQRLPSRRGGDRGQEAKQIQQPVASFDIEADAQRQGQSFLA